MPRRCVAAGCNTKSGEGYSLHGFPREQDLHAKWVQAVKRQRSNWDGPSKHSMLCSKHFEADCFVTGGMRYRDSIGLPTNKRLKTGAVYIYTHHIPFSICHPWRWQIKQPSHETSSREATTTGSEY